MLRVIVSLAFAGSLMHSATAIAEEEKPEPVRYTTISDLVSPTGYLYSLDRKYYLDDLEFQDNSPLGRISRIRQLPLLTLSENRRSRIYIGVDSNGILGLHIGAR